LKIAVSKGFYHVRWATVNSLPVIDAVDAAVPQVRGYIPGRLFSRATRIGVPGYVWPMKVEASERAGPGE